MADHLLTAPLLLRGLVLLVLLLVPASSQLAYQKAGACAILGFKTTSGDDFRVAFLVDVPSDVAVHATD